MSSVSGSNTPKKNIDHDYFLNLVSDSSKRTKQIATLFGSVVKECLENFKQRSQGYRLRNEDVTSDFQWHNHRFNKINKQIDQDIELVSLARDELQQEMTTLKKIESICSKSLSTSSSQDPEQQLQEPIQSDILSSDTETDRAMLEGQQEVSYALTIVEANLGKLYKFKQITEDQLKLLVEQNEITTILKVKELAFRIFHDQAVVPSQIKEKLSGSTPQLSLQKMIDDLEQRDSGGNYLFQKVLGDKFYTCKHQLETLQEDMATFDSYIREKNEDQKEVLLDELVEMYTTLPIGEPRLFQGGYQLNNEIGHSVLYEFERVGEDEYKLSLFNTGEGRPRTGAEVLSYTFNKEKMSKDFLRELFVFRHPPNQNEPAGSSRFVEMKDIHEYLDDHLGTGIYERPIPTQTWGNCSYMTLQAWLYSKLDSKSYETFTKLVRENAAKQLQEFLPSLSEEIKQRLFGDSVISELKNKVWQMSWESTPLLGRITNLFYNFSVSRSNQSQSSSS